MIAEKAYKKKKLKYPKSVFFIVTNEFCERFSYYGMRTILVLYLRNKLNYSDDTSTVIYHAFTMLVYFFPLLGAMMADSLLGKFKTIFYVSIIYAIGQIVLSISAVPGGLPSITFSMLGLLLIAIGTGGIKPCVAAFGGDQFVLPQQERYLAMFFSLFYFAINSGSLISTFITPILRQDVACFGENTCYSLAFFVPAVLMVVSIVIFVIGKPLYTIKDPEGNVVLNVAKCICRGIGNKIKAKKGEERSHWLEYADDKYETKLIEDIKAALQVLKLFIPLPIFWALFDQQGSRWTFQATRMDGQIGSFLLKPDQMQVVNPLLILLFIPLFETCIYPLLAKIRLINTPLKKLTVGGMLAGLAFIISALVELELEKTYAVTPSSGLAQVRVFNTMNCDVNMTVGQETFVLKSLDIYTNTALEADGTVTLNYAVNSTECSNLGISSGTLTLSEATATSFALTETSLYSYNDSVDKTTTGDPAVRGLISINSGSSASLSFIENSNTVLNLTINSTFFETDLTEIDPGTYDIYLAANLVQSSVKLKLGGIYTVVGNVDASGSAVVNTITVTEPNSVHMLWLIPQYVVITMGEVMFSVTGLEFAFTQAPLSMKSLLQAGWLLTVAFGNLIVVIVAEASYFSSQASEFFLFAGLMFLDMLIFAVMAKYYKYVEVPDNESQNGDIALEEKTGAVNASFKSDEK